MSREMCFEENIFAIRNEPKTNVCDSQFQAKFSIVKRN